MENFEQYLINKYPDLFYDEKNGKECPCGAWVPEGWEMIIDELCGSIDSYIKNTYSTNKVITNKSYYFWNSIVEFLNWGHKWLIIKLFTRYNKWEYNKPFFTFVEKFKQRAYKCVKYVKFNPPSVKIDQIKEKFGGLRFYTNGGDKQVQGMILFAEYLCSKTCDVSGEPGELCMRGGWYKTLSPKIAIEIGYKPTK